MQAPELVVQEGFTGIPKMVVIVRRRKWPTIRMTADAAGCSVFESWGIFEKNFTIVGPIENLNIFVELMWAMDGFKESFNDATRGQ